MPRAAASLAVVQHFEAGSKFFRCFTVVLLLPLAAWPVHHAWPLAVVQVLLALLMALHGAAFQGYQLDILVGRHPHGTEIYATNRNSLTPTEERSHAHGSRLAGNDMEGNQ